MQFYFVPFLNKYEKLKYCTIYILYLKSNVKSNNKHTYKLYKRFF